MAANDDHAQNIANNLNQAGFNTNSADVTPTTAETPLGIDVETGLKDLQYMAEADLQNGNKIRVTESKNPLNLLLNKLRSKKKVNEEVVEK